MSVTIIATPAGHQRQTHYTNLNITGFAINTDNEGRPELNLTIKSMDYGQSELNDLFVFKITGTDAQTLKGICEAFGKSPEVSPHAEIPDGVKSLFR